MIKSEDMERWLALAKSGVDGYADEGRAKAFFLRTGRRILNELAGKMGLAKGTFTVRINEAGPAVSGEIWLNAPDVLVEISGSFDLGVRYCRTRPRPARNGPNRWLRWDILRDLDQVAFMVSSERATDAIGP